VKFFNIDLHISVIADIKFILSALGHEVTDWTLSGHAWVMGRQRDTTDVITADNWSNIDKAMCDAFYARYKDELAGYDAFIVTHTPALAMLYERWGKPIIVVASTRYEQPFGRDAERWRAFNGYLEDMHGRGLLVPLANNKYDAAYAMAFTGIEWRHVPSLCEYTGATAKLERPEFLYWGEYRGLKQSRRLIDKDELRPHRHQRIFRRLVLGDPFRGFRWSDIARYRGIVHMPYNASVMSLFEHYTANLPLFVPDKPLMRQLYAEHRQEGVLSQLSFNQVYRTPPGSIIPAAGSDPNDYDDVDTMMQWLNLADFYDTENMPHIQYFSSGEDLEARLQSMDAPAMSDAIRTANVGRHERVYAAWRQIIEQLASR
jgi:hypothetical protein